MKIINKSLFLLLALAIFTSCDRENTSQKAEDTSETSSAVADMKEVKLDIQGMTCEIGCAKLIQSKLYKTNGVDFARISFADSSGVVRYDANLLTESDVVQTVEDAGGGDLYRVKRITPITSLDSTAVSEGSAP